MATSRPASQNASHDHHVIYDVQAGSENDATSSSTTKEWKRFCERHATTAANQVWILKSLKSDEAWGKWFLKILQDHFLKSLIYTTCVWCSLLQQLYKIGKFAISKAMQLSDLAACAQYTSCEWALKVHFCKNELLPSKQKIKKLFQCFECCSFNLALTSQQMPLSFTSPS